VRMKMILVFAMAVLLVSRSASLLGSLSRTKMDRKRELQTVLRWVRRMVQLKEYRSVMMYDQVIGYQTDWMLA